MKKLKYFLEYLIVKIFFFIFSIVGYKLASNIGGIIGKTFGPFQHFWLAKQRAIETGIPMVRVSNSGISSLIAPNGKEIKSLKFGTSGFLESKIPKKFNETLYLKFGEKIYYSITLFLIFLFLGVKLKSSFILQKLRN